MGKIWKYANTLNLFRSEKSRSSIKRDVERGLLPEPQRKQTGTTYTYYWETRDLPQIGAHYGFLSQPDSTKIIAVYSPKGGVLKTSLAFNIARMAAINNIKTLVIGLEVQCSISECLAREDVPSQQIIKSIEDMNDAPGLYEVSEHQCSIRDVILPTDLPTLNYISESSTLNLLEQKIQGATRREMFISRLIKPILNDYQLIVFDNSAYWMNLVKNSLVAATDIVCPIGCNLLAGRSVVKNISGINQFKVEAELDWNSFVLVPTMLQSNNISKTIEALYRTHFPELVVNGSIRHRTKGEDANLRKESVIEHSMKSELANDYYQVINDIWRRVNNEN